MKTSSALFWLSTNRIDIWLNCISCVAFTVTYNVFSCFLSVKSSFLLNSLVCEGSLAQLISTVWTDQSPVNRRARFS